MCIVLDANSWGYIFTDKNTRHSDFAPVLNWIRKGNGKAVYGGSTYEMEMKNAIKFRRFFVELGKARRIIVVDKDKVDAKEKEFKQHVKNSDFDDPHIVAIVVVSGALLVCTVDKRSMRFIKNPIFYKSRRVPKIYSSIGSKKILCDRNIPARYL